MKINGRNIADTILKIAALIAVFGMSFASLSDRGRGMWNAGKNDIKQNRLLDSVLRELAIIKEADKYIFHWGRSMTDDNDKTSYIIQYGNMGTDKDIHEADVRNNNDGDRMVFIWDYWWVPPLRIDDADSTRLIVVLHDLWNNKTKEVKLIPQ